jgi:hypothetical protein
MLEVLMEYSYGIRGNGYGLAVDVLLPLVH